MFPSQTALHTLVVEQWGTTKLYSTKRFEVKTFCTVVCYSLIVSIVILLQVALNFPFLLQSVPGSPKYVYH